MEQIRLNKYIAHCGVCSRRDADRLISQGRVEVNGITASPGQTVTDRDLVTVSGKPVSAPRDKVVLAYYKPVGITCTERDPHAEKTVADAIRYPVRVTYAGRLDRDSEGLLLLSNDGDLIQKMMRGSERHEKEYIVRVDKEITDVFLNKMSRGIYLKDLEVKTRECELEKLGKNTFRIVLTQGLNRQIRRMCTACGYRVRGIKRVRVMHIVLDGLRPGEYRELPAEEVERLYRDCGLEFTKNNWLGGTQNAV